MHQNNHSNTENFYIGHLSELHASSHYYDCSL